LCTMPKPVTMCEASCPMGTTIKYKDSTKMVKTSPTIKCIGTDWIEAMSDSMAGVTCQLPANSPLITNTRPTGAGVTACPDLTAFTCVGFMCEPTQLRYAPSGNGYTVTCQEGSLVTNLNVPGDILRANCDIGAWQPAITSANCVVETEDEQVADCLALMTDPTVMGNVNFDCALGACYMSCKGATQM
ncbi:hypothetical protein PENTCL1PPCAC_28024, partial [Pristionchus entomophagus]